jgi:tRNA threonylcarbamoyl adenosine modification protein (Sua5/YciO/YrdC/YwlC family)
MSEHHRLAVLCPDMSTASAYAHFSQTAFRIARKLFPGPYTLILPATSEVPRLLLERRRRRVGIRVPDHTIPLTLLRAVGRPILTSSAIAPGSDHPCVDVDGVAEAFGRHVDLVIDGGPTGDLPSTVLSIDDESGLVVVREGRGQVDAALEL